MCWTVDMIHHEKRNKIPRHIKHEENEMMVATAIAMCGAFRVVKKLQTRTMPVTQGNAM